MTSIANLTATMQDLLTTQADAIARETGLVHRTRAMSGAQFVQTLVFGWITNPNASLLELASLAATFGADITRQGLHAWITDAAVETVRRLAQHASLDLVVDNPVVQPIFAHFAAVYIRDSSVISLPSALADAFPSCGGTSAHPTAAMKLHVRWELQRGQIEGPLLLPGRCHDRSVTFRAPLPSNSLMLQDLGFFQLDELAAWQQDGIHWLTRLKPGTAVFVAGKRIDLGTWLPRQASVVDVAITMGVAQRIPCRLIAIKVPPHVAAQRRARIRQEARDRGQAVSEGHLHLAGWLLIVTTIPEDIASAKEVVVLSKVRWQIETLFKLWKSHGKLDETRGHRPERVLVEFYAKWVGLLLQHGVMLLSVWNESNRSLANAAAVIRTEWYTVMSAFGKRAACRRAARAMVAAVSRLGRQGVRKKKPHTYQLLRNPSLLNWLEAVS